MINEVMPVKPDKLILIGILIFFLFSEGCKSPDLERYQARRKATLRGSFLTESPDEIQFPVKVLLGIGCSHSMGDE